MCALPPPLLTLAAGSRSPCALPHTHRRTTSPCAPLINASLPARDVSETYLPPFIGADRGG